MTHETINVFFGDSINASNGEQQGMPKFGRFASIVNSDSISLIQDTQRRWHIGLPFGSTLCVGKGGKRETRERFEQIRKSVNADGFSQFKWRTDFESAKREAIDKCRRRHEAHLAESAAYSAKYGKSAK